MHAIPPSTLPLLTRPLSMMGPVGDSKNYVASSVTSARKPSNDIGLNFPTLAPMGL